MSAWIVDRAHIDVLVQALCEGETVTHPDPDSVGRTLWRECLTSVAYRYPNDGDGQRPGPITFRDGDVDTYTYRRPARKIDPRGVLMAVACYQYQSCEHPGWESSDACEWTTTLRQQLGRHLGSEELPDQSEWPWGFDEIDVHGERERIS